MTVVLCVLAHLLGLPNTISYCTFSVLPPNLKNLLLDLTNNSAAGEKVRLPHKIEQFYCFFNDS
jgi:hypothetical protein